MLHTHIAFLRKFYISGLLSTSFLLAIITLAFFPVTHSYSGAQAASVVSETTLSMTAQNVDLPLSVSNVNGTFGTSEPASFTVTTNNYSGYTLNIHASTNDDNYSKLINGQSVLNSISAAATDETGFNNGNWGFKPSMLNSDPNSNYLPAPTYAGTTIDETDGANPNNTANTYNIAIGAKVDYGQAAGKYSNTFVITAVANAVGYSVTYNENTEDTVTDMPANQSGNATAQSIEISSTTPSRNGYTFINWCDSTTTTTSGVDSCNGNVYQPGDSYDTDQTTTNNLVLKAMWQQQVVNGYTINFDANNGTGTMNPQVIPYGESDNLDANTFTRANYIFDGWNTADDGNGTDYADEAPFTAPADDTGGSSITLYAKWATPVYDTIVFNGNGADGGSMSNQQIMQGTSADLTANAYTKTGYIFDGWNERSDGLGNGYGDEKKFTATNTGTAKTINLYARWLKDDGSEGGISDGNGGYIAGITIQDALEKAYTEIQKGMYEEDTPGSNTFHYVDSWHGGEYLGEGRDVRYLIQDISLEVTEGGVQYSVCNYTTVIGSTALVLDIRDQTSYRIVKAADGRCWMQDNLALDPLGTGVTLTTTNTNANQTAIDNYLVSNSNAPAGWSTSAVEHDPMSGGDYYNKPRINITNKDVLPTTYDIGGTDVDDSLKDLVLAEKWKVGGYYNYCAASIGTYCYDQGDGIDRDQTSAVDAEYDICPAGWRLPTGGAISSTGTTAGGGEYQKLYDAYASNNSGDTQTSRLRKALRLPLSGSIYHDYGSYIDEQGYSGYFWSSTYQNTYYMYILDVNSSSSYPQNYKLRGEEYPIRCIAK